MEKQPKEYRVFLNIEKILFSTLILFAFIGCLNQAVLLSKRLFWEKAEVRVYVSLPEGCEPDETGTKYVCPMPKEKEAEKLTE